MDHDNNLRRLIIGARQVLVSLDDEMRLPQKGSCVRRSVLITDVATGKKLWVRRTSCGLPNCFCALKSAHMKGSCQ